MIVTKTYSYVFITELLLLKENSFFSNFAFLTSIGETYTMKKWIVHKNIY